MSDSGISRRDFLKLAGAGLLGLLLPQLDLEPALAQFDPNHQGRVTTPTLNVYDTPALTGQVVKAYWRDIIFPIIGIVISEDETAFNRVWYKIGEGCYAYSGAIQPVRTLLNPQASILPQEGALAEVTVPYTDARWDAGKDKEFAYRFYYETTHWAVGMVQDIDGNSWYKVYDDKWKFHYYAQAEHLRIIPTEELAPLSPDLPSQLKRIEVHLNEQVVIAYEDQNPVFMARIASGGRFRNGTYSTPVGHHMTYHKRPFRHMAAGDLASNGYDLPGVPWVSYITETGVALHGTYWHNDFGHPRSHGCINLTPQAAKWLYRWTLPIVPPNEQTVYEKYGTGVDVFE
ncbi:MAG: L,D-transpeptidase [Anaerolineales bacterium]|nr:L,D-transpeptidase [Anaerolineales bacterium]